MIPYVSLAGLAGSTCRCGGLGACVGTGTDTWYGGTGAGTGTGYGGTGAGTGTGVQGTGRGC